MAGVGPLLFPSWSPSKVRKEEKRRLEKGNEACEVMRLRREEPREGQPQLGGTAMSDLLLSWIFLYSHHMETTYI